MKKEGFIIRVSRQTRENSVCSQMASVQEALIGVADVMEKDNKKLHKLCREFSKLKRMMYGVDNGEGDDE